MHWRQPLIAIMLLVSLIGSWAPWVFVIPVLAHGAHHTSVRLLNGRAAIVLEHEHGEPFHHHADAPDGFADAEATSDDRGRDHVVALPDSGDLYSTPSPPQLPHDGGPTIALATTIDFATLQAPLVSRVACLGVGPPVPSRSSILRI